MAVFHVTVVSRERAGLVSVIRSRAHKDCHHHSAKAPPEIDTPLRLVTPVSPTKIYFQRHGITPDSIDKLALLMLLP